MKSILVSGGNSGIGLQATREFVAQGHRVVPAFYGSVTKAAHNAVHATVRDEWPAATYWGCSATASLPERVKAAKHARMARPH